MAVSSEQKNTEVRLWLLLRRVGDQLSLCEDLVYSKFGLTSEQFAVLGCIKSRGPLRPTDLAALLDRSPNSVSMLVDRMVKAGLVKRRRDTKDRRVVFVSMTDKGSEGIDQAAPAGWEFIQKVLSTLPYDEQRTLANTLETVKCELVGYVNPEMDTAEICKASITRDPNLYGRLVKNVLPSGREADRKGKKKGKTD
jgi:MarR family transcriptional regulator, temperature-dependent positive regulator of motility